MKKAEVRAGLIASLALFAILTILAKVPPVAAWNRTSSLWLQGPDNDLLWWLAVGVEWLFSAELTMAVTVIACLLMWRSGQTRLALSLALFFPVALASAALKFIVQIPGPLGFLVVRHGVTGPPSSTVEVPYSYPSGHTVRAAFLILWLVAVLLKDVRLRRIIAAAVISAFIGWTRIYLGAHFLFDVLGGLSLAAVALIPAIGIALQPHHSYVPTWTNQSQQNALERLR